MGAAGRRTVGSSESSSAPGHGAGVPLSCGGGRGVLELPAAARWTQCKALKRAGAHQPVLSATRRHYRRERAKAAADWYAHGVSWRRWVRCDVLPDWRPLSRAGCGGKADGCGRIGDGGWLVSAPRSRAVLPSWPTTAGSSPSVTLLATSGGCSRPAADQLPAVVSPRVLPSLALSEPAAWRVGWV